jgi:hypothetical protein
VAVLLVWIVGVGQVVDHGHRVLVLVGFGKVVILTDGVFMLVLVFHSLVAVPVGVTERLGHRYRIVGHTQPVEPTGHGGNCNQARRA